MMNAGAYGGEVKQYLTEVDVLDTSFKVQTVKASELDLRYRYSRLQGTGKYITKAVFRLDNGNIEEAKATYAVAGREEAGKAAA